MNTIAEKLADAGLDDLESVLDPLFLKSNQPNSVKHEIFKEFFLKDMKTNLTERDLDLFMKSHPVLGAGLSISKADLLSILEEPFRVAQYKSVERDSFMKQQKTQA